MVTVRETSGNTGPVSTAAGVNAKSLSVYMGHSSITITLDRYGHLFEGNENEAAKLLDDFLVRSDSEARKAQIETPT